MMKKKIRLLLAAGAAAAALTACTRADTDNGGMAGSAAPSQAQSAANTDSQGTEAAETSPAQDLSVTGGGTEGGDTLNGLTEETGAAGGQTELAQEPAQESETMGTEEAAASPEAGTEPETLLAEENYSDEEFDAMNETEGGELAADWNGTFTSAEGETLSITPADETHIAFAFLNAGVSGEAEVDGKQAVYYGDDYHMVVFSYVEGAVEVSVLSEEDYDTSGSPMNGTYTRS